MAQLLQARKMGRYLGTRVLFRGVDLVIGNGERMGLIGPNGSGRLRVVFGEACRLGPPWLEQYGMTLRSIPLTSRVD